MSAKYCELDTKQIADLVLSGKSAYPVTRLHIADGNCYRDLCVIPGNRVVSVGLDKTVRIAEVG